jgi:hypothetical protein
MTGPEAVARLTELEFSKWDSIGMVKDVQRTLPGARATGLTSTHLIAVSRQSGRYQVTTEPRGHDPAPCMWRRDDQGRVIDPVNP